MSHPHDRPSAHFGFRAPILAQALRVAHDGRGWGEPALVARREVDVPLASGAVQYGLSCFEGLKALRAPDGSVHLFRPDRHGARLAASCRRLCLPELAPEAFVAHVVTYVEAVAAEVPAHGQGALYLRPTVVAVEEQIGVCVAARHELAIVATPVPEPARRALSLWFERDLVRAAPGGLGAAKTGGNYAAGLLGSERARARGHDQVVWLDALERRYLAEAGVMNVFVVLDGTVVTPPLDDTILAGVTRDSCLTLLRAWGVPVAERKIALDEVVAAHAGGKLGEAFGTGTAACVVPIARLQGAHEDLVLQPGEVATRLRAELSAIQSGRVADGRGWRVPVGAG